MVSEETIMRTKVITEAIASWPLGHLNAKRDQEIAEWNEDVQQLKGSNHVALRQALAATQHRSNMPTEVRGPKT